MLGQDLRDLGLADAGVALEQQRPLEVAHQQQRRREARLGDVARVRELLLQSRDVERALRGHASILGAFSVAHHLPNIERSQPLMTAQARARALSSALRRAALGRRPLPAPARPRPLRRRLLQARGEIGGELRRAPGRTTGPIRRAPKLAALPLIETSLLPDQVARGASSASMRAVRSIEAAEVPVVSVPLANRCRVRVDASRLLHFDFAPKRQARGPDLDRRPCPCNAWRRPAR